MSFKRAADYGTIKKKQLIRTTEVETQSKEWLGNSRARDNVAANPPLHHCGGVAKLVNQSYFAVLIIEAIILTIFLHNYSQTCVTSRGADNDELTEVVTKYEIASS